jgi:phage gp36-like protein
MYATLADLTDRYGQDALLVVADRDLDGVIDAQIVDDALNDATAEIDSWLAVRYDLPLPTVPSVVTRLCCDIAMYRLSPIAATGTDERRLRYEDALRLMKALANGDASLGLAAKTAVTNNGRAVLVSPDRNFRVFKPINRSPQ